MRMVEIRLEEGDLISLLGYFYSLQIVVIVRNALSLSFNIIVMMNDQIKKIKVLDLELDINNPRFAELYNEDLSQDAIVNYLLKEE